jgi:uncharacterized membrane-anchored protein YitT (DUF2179 family)
MKLTGKQIAVGIKEYLIMAIGMYLYAFGWVACVIPAGGMGGGATGLSILLNHLFPQITMGTFVFIINFILLIIAGFIVGWNFGIKTIYCIVMLSIAMDVCDAVIPENILVYYTQNIDSHNILLVILGAVIAGTGVATSFSQGGSTGGTDIVAMIINKYRKISYGRIVVFSDFIIIASALFVSDFGIDGVIYGYVFVAVFGYTVDMIQAGNNNSNQIFIVTHDYQAMADAMLYKANRGATLLDAQGWYSKEEKKIVMVVCRKRDTSMILKIAKSVDPYAFISVGSVMGVYGKGFDALNKV